MAIPAAHDLHGSDPESIKERHHREVKAEVERTIKSIDSLGGDRRAIVTGTGYDEELVTELRLKGYSVSHENHPYDGVTYDIRWGKK